MCGAWQCHNLRRKGAEGSKSWRQSQGDSGTRTSWMGLPVDAGGKIVGVPEVSTRPVGVPKVAARLFWGSPAAPLAGCSPPIEVPLMRACTHALAPFGWPGGLHARRRLLPADHYLGAEPRHCDSGGRHGEPRWRTTEGATQVNPTVANDIIHVRIQDADQDPAAEEGLHRRGQQRTRHLRVRYYVGVKQSTSYVTTTSGVGMGGPATEGSGYGYGGYGYGWGG